VLRFTVDITGPAWLNPHALDAHHASASDAAMTLNSQSSQQKFPFSFDEVFDAIVAVIPTLAGFRLRSNDYVKGRVEAKIGVGVFSRGKNLTVMVKDIDDTNTLVVIQSAMKHEPAHTSDHPAERILVGLTEFLKVHSRKRQLKNATDVAIPAALPVVVGTSIRLDRLIPVAKDRQPAGIPFYCSDCGQSFVIDQRAAGRRVDCPKCRAELKVPTARRSDDEKM